MTPERISLVEVAKLALLPVIREQPAALDELQLPAIVDEL